MRIAYLITHPNVVVDPHVPVSRWSLSALGRERMRQMLSQPWVATITAVYSSAEQKAIDGARILAHHLELTPHIVEALGEIDRSSTGYLPAEEHAVVATAFFAEPDRSIRGWETARAAQQRIIKAVEAIVAADATPGNIAMVAHGAVATLYLCQLKGVPIMQEQRPPAPDGGAYYCFEIETKSLVQDWKLVDE
jgi:broad specificity phosphatase PhoE